MAFSTNIVWENEVSNILHMSFEGKTLREIGEYYGVSKQRIAQIAKKYDVHLGGKRYITSLKREADNIDKLLKWGARDSSDLYKAKREKYRNKKHQAKGSGILFNIEFGELVWPSHCPILGIELDYFAEGRQENSVSFDRIDPDQGYISGNVRIVSWRANRIKNDGTAEEHYLIYKYMNNTLY